MATRRIEFTGKFFEARDPAQTMKENIRAMLDDTASEIEEEVRVVFASGEGTRRPIRVIARNARASAFIRGRVESLSGRPWQYHAVVSPARTGLSARQAVALYAASSVIEGRTHAFRNATRHGRRSLRDLTAGLE